MLTKGKLKVATEMRLSFLVYNFRRAVNLLGGKWNNEDDYDLYRSFFLLKWFSYKGDIRKNAPAARLSHTDKLLTVFFTPLFLIFGQSHEIMMKIK